MMGGYFVDVELNVHRILNMSLRSDRVKHFQMCYPGISETEISLIEQGDWSVGGKNDQTLFVPAARTFEQEV